MVAEYRLQHVISHLNSDMAGIGRPLWSALWNLRALRNVTQTAGHGDLSRWCKKVETELLKLHTARAEHLDESLSTLKEACRYIMDCARARATSSAEPEPSDRLVTWFSSGGVECEDLEDGKKAYDLELEVYRGKLRVHVPNPESPHDQLSLIWRLQEVLRDALPYRCVTIDLSAYREIPLSLLSVLTMIEKHLRQEGRLCIVEGPNPDPAAPATADEPCRRIIHKRQRATRMFRMLRLSHVGEVRHGRRA
jgi:hypothetical protein